MGKRRWLVLGLLALAVAIPVAHPSTRWRMLGWYRGEAFYEGWPSSFWRHELQEFIAARHGQHSSWLEQNLPFLLGPKVEAKFLKDPLAIPSCLIWRKTRLFSKSVRTVHPRQLVTWPSFPWA